MDIAIYFILTLAFATLFSMGGVGSAIALVTIFPMAGMPANLAKATGLFINAASTGSASVMNLIRKTVDIRETLPLVIAILIATPVGAYSSTFVSATAVSWVLAIFLVVSGTLLLRSKTEARFSYTRPWVLFAVGAGVGLVSGLLGVGGGALIMPLLILLGFDAKKAAYAVSFVIPFSSLGAFMTYLQFVDMDWILLAWVTVAALLGGYLGNRIMYFRLTQAQVKRLIGVVLYLLAIKLIVTLL